MTAAGDFIAIDWGTSNRRALLLGSDGTVRDRMSDGRGMLSMDQAGYPAEVAALRGRFGAETVIAAGMVGAVRGWREVPYVAVPAALPDLAAGVVSVAPGVSIVPGLCEARGRHDVMRGEETLVLGAVAAGLVPADARVCQPGTHNKWVEVVGGRIAGFATAMTGELFALLKAGGTLAGLLDGDVVEGAAFAQGLARGSGARDLAAALFEARAQMLLGARPIGDVASYVSGVLIGADVGARPDLSGGSVYLVGAGPLAALYRTAIAAAGAAVIEVDAEAAFVAGAHAIRRLLA